MDDLNPDFSHMNQIAFNGNLRDQLETLHQMLGYEITDIASNSLQFGVKFAGEVDKVLAYMSEIASKLTSALVEARESKKNLTGEEQEDYAKIESLTIDLGNLQDKLNRVNKVAKQINVLNSKMHENSIGLSEEIMGTQARVREIRSDINAYGFLSKSPKLAYMFDEDERQKEADENRSN